MAQQVSFQSPTLELRNERIGFNSPAYNRRIDQVQRAVQSLQEKAVISRERNDYTRR